MLAGRHFIILLSIAVAGVWAIGGAQPCSAQWVPRPGHGAVSIAYQYARSKYHLFSQDVAGLQDPSGSGYVGGPGNKGYIGDTFGQSATLAAEYGIWRGLAVSAAGTYATSRYSGKDPEGSMDDGRYHGGLQDGSITAAFMLQWHEFAITPSVGAVVPLRDYAVLGHSAIGRHRHEYPVGIAIGRSLSPILPRAYAAGSYSYSLVEDLHEYTLDQRHYEADAGYFLTNSISIGGAIQYLTTVDGIDWLTGQTSMEAHHEHDVAAKANYVRVGGYASLSLGGGFGLRISYFGTTSGSNADDLNALTIAPTWAFSGPAFR